MTADEKLADDLKNEVASAASALGLSLKHLGKPKDPVNPEVLGKGKAYETWVALEIAERLHKAGITVESIDHKGYVVSEFRVRGAPGKIPSIKATGDQPCLLRLSSLTQKLDLHISLQHRGFSDALHELDISVVPFHVVPKLIAKIKRPHDGDCYLGIELKNYKQDQPINLNIARAFLGVAIDLDPRFATIGHPPGDAHMTLLTSAKVPGGSTMLLKAYGIEASEGVIPLGNLAPFDQIVHWLMFLLSKPAKP